MLESELEEFKEGTIRGQVVKKLEEELFELYKDENLDIKPPQLEKRGGAYYEEKVNFVHFGLNNGSKPAGMLWLKQKRGRFRCFGCIPNLGY